MKNWIQFPIWYIMTMLLVCFIACPCPTPISYNLFKEQFISLTRRVYILGKNIVIFHCCNISVCRLYKQRNNISLTFKTERKKNDKTREINKSEPFVKKKGGMCARLFWRATMTTAQEQGLNAPRGKNISKSRFSRGKPQYEAPARLVVLRSLRSRRQEDQ